MLQRSVESLLGTVVLGFVHRGDRRRIARGLVRAVATPGHSERLECRVIGGDARWRAVSVIAAVLPDAVLPEMVLLSAIDVTERREQEESLRHLFLHDTVTGLGNRALLEERLRQQRHAQRH